MVTERPESDALMAQFASRDPHQVWLAAHSVLASWDRAFLRKIAERRAEIEAATEGLDLGGAFRPNRLALMAALDRAAFSSEQTDCLCRFYPRHDFYAPDREAGRGHVKVTGREVDREAYETRFAVTCSACGTRMQATEQAGWHIPLYRWEIIP